VECGESQQLVGLKCDWSAVINYEILGKVTARQEDWAPDLTPQLQLLLARLVYANDTPVRKSEIERAVWDQGMVPDGGLKRLVYELRTLLRDVVPDSGSVISKGDMYQLPVEKRQVDALRFTAKLDQAGNIPGPEQTRYAREALDEWGPRASGLFGGYPLLGLEGGWANGVRRKLRARYRDVTIDLLRQDAAAEDYETLLRRCARLGAEDQEDPDGRFPQEAMRDEEFLGLWILGAYRSGQPERAKQVLVQATDIAARSGKPLSAELRRRADLLSAEPRAGGSRGTTATAPPSSIPPASDRRTMTEPVINFNNNAGSIINGQFGYVRGGVTFNTGRGTSAENITADENEDDNEVKSTRGDGNFDE
jgi:DNA-binding SARP family transcriptional activator